MGCNTNSSNKNSSNIPVIVTGDFNQQRRRDYSSKEWNRIAESANRRRVPTDDGVSSTLEANSFRCVFDDVLQRPSTPGKAAAAVGDDNAEVRCNWDEASPPPSTHWSG